MSLRPFWHSTVGLWRSKTHGIIGIFMTIITVLSMSFHTLICPAFILVQSRVRSGQEDVSSAWTYFLVWVRLLQWLKWGGGRGNGGGFSPLLPFEPTAIVWAPSPWLNLLLLLLLLLSSVTHPPGHARLQVDPMHETAGMGKLINAALLSLMRRVWVYAVLPFSWVNSSAPLVCRHDRVTREVGRVGLVGRDRGRRGHWVALYLYIYTARLLMSVFL